MPCVVDADFDTITDAADRLRRGEVVAFPTETVYGLGADTLQARAVQRIYELKGRPADNPLICHVGSPGEAQPLVRAWDDRAGALAARFWPGPLTLVLMRSDRVPAASTANLPTIALRSPAHPVARQLLESFGGAISAPSANRSGLVSPTSAAHVAADFADAADLLIIDGGRCQVGIESTVLDLTARPPRVLRPGAVSVPELRQVIGDVTFQETRSQDISPGTLPAHYAPRTPSVMVESHELAAALAAPQEPAVVLCFDRRAVRPPHRPIVMPQGAGAYAHHLYDALREADDVGCGRIVIEQPPLSNELWWAIHDRLVRATSE